MSKNNEFSDLIDNVNASRLPYKEHNLLLTDLCGRLLHGVKCALYSKYSSRPKMGQVVSIDARMGHITVLEENFDMPVAYGTWQVKPYLRPLEDMTERERSLYNDLRNALTYQENGEYDLDDFNELNDFLNRNHLDYRGLIEKGLAIKVTPKNNPYNNK